MNLKSHHNMRGIILMPILLTLSLVAVVALMIVKQSNIETENIIRGHAPIQVKYSGLAGLEIGEEELKKDLDCENFSVVSTGTFAGMGFNSSVSPTSGSPVTLSVIVDPTSAAQTFTREVTMFDNSVPAPDLLIPVSAGTYLRSGSPDTNYSSATTYHVKHNIISPDRVALYKFDLSSIDIPVEYIISASLELHLSGIPNNFISTVDLFRIASDWSETEATFNERLSGVAWKTSDLDWTPVSQTVVDENTIGWKSFDVTELLTGWLNGDFPNYGLELQAQILTSNNLEFISENHTDTTKHPVLKVKYACECGKTCDVVLACNGDYVPNNKVSEIDSDAFGVENISGLSYLNEGESFNGQIVPSDGAWLSLDQVKKKIYMTDISGVEISNISTPGISPSGLSSIEGGVYVDHFAMTDQLTGYLYFLDTTGTSAVVFNMSSAGITSPVGVTFIKRSASGTYDNMLAVLNQNGVVLIMDQSGSVYGTIDYSSAGLSDPQDIVHLIDTDTFLIVDRGLKQVVKFNMGGTWLSNYPIDTYGANSARAITINGDNCDHVIGDDGSDNLISLNVTESGGSVLNMTFNPVGDTYIDESSFDKNKNYGGEVFMETGYDIVNNEHRSLIKFDVSALPSGAIINSATLRLYPNTKNPFLTKINAYKLVSDWQESQASWSNIGKNQNVDDVVLGTMDVSFYSEDWQELSLPTSLINEWISDDEVQDQGIVLRAVYGNVVFKTRQSGSLFMPQLVIDYTEP